MKRKFSTKWRSSSQPRKQRKYRANAPLHLRKEFVNINLSKDLRKKQKKRSIQAKKGDKVKIMRGKFKGEVGKILEVKLKDSKIIVEGMQVKKQDGSKVHIKLQPSNLQIIELSERLKKIPAEIKANKTEKLSSDGVSPGVIKSTNEKTKNKKMESNINSEVKK